VGPLGGRSDSAVFPSKSRWSISAPSSSSFTVLVRPFAHGPVRGRAAAIPCVHTPAPLLMKH
jgi:hypothetical protein